MPNNGKEKKINGSGNSKEEVKAQFSDEGESSEFNWMVVFDSSGGVQKNI